MSNVQLYQQVAAEVSPSLRPVVPQPQEVPAPTSDDFEEEVAAELFQDAPSSPSSDHLAMPMTAQALRVTGSRPHRFTGRHLAMATSWNNSVSSWYEINLYEADGGNIICDVRLFNKDADSNDLYRVSRHGDWRSAVAWLEGYNSAQDIVCHVSVDDDGLSAAEVSLQGITLRQRVLALQTQYKATLGNLLFELKLDLDD